MAPTRVRALPLVLGLAGLVAAGTAAAYLIRQSRDVTTSSDKAYKLYHEGIENDLKMYYREAMASYAEALQYDPHFVMATIRLAERMREKDPARANALLASAARSRDELTPREKLLIDIWQERWGKRDLKKLEALYDEYLRRYPKDPEAYHMRAQFLANNGRTSEAIADYERLIAVNPNYASAYNTLGYYWASKGDTAKAEDNLKRYRYLAPGQANPFDSLGELYAHTGRYDEAEENFRKALSIKSDFYASLGHMGTVEAGRGRYAEAAEWFRKAAAAIDSVPAQHEFRFYAALMLVDSGRPDEAVREMDSIVAEDASLPGGKDTARLKAHDHLVRAVILGRVGRTAEAEAELIAADPTPLLDPTEAGKKEREYVEKDLRFVRGVILMGAGRDAEAVPLLTEALDRKSKDGLGGTDYFAPQSFSRLALARSLGRLGRVEEAEKILAPILEKNPHYAPALEMMARIRGGKPATAASAAQAHRPGGAS